MKRLLIACVFAGCSSDSVTVETDHTLTGVVGGQSWTFVAGETDAFLSNGSQNFFALFYASDYLACASSPPPGSSLIVAVPKQPGDYDFTSNRNMTFVVGAGDNLVTFEGRVIVDSVDGATVRGALAGSYDGDNDVNGTFELSICSQ